jgi:tetratricopeptide (TPR) repeat protein
MLESTRAYGLERLREAGDHERSARAHAAFFAAAFGDGDALFSAQIAERLAAIEVELGDLRAVLTWALVDANDRRLGAGLACALGRFWSSRLPREGLRWLELVQSGLEGSGGDRSLAAGIAIALGAVLPHGSAERLDAAKRAIDVARASGKPRLIARALAAAAEQFAPVDSEEMRAAARAAFEESLEQARAVNSDWDSARALAGLASLAIDRGDIATARELGRAAIGLFEKIGARDGVAYASMTLGEAEFAAGNFEDALELGRRARAAYDSLRNVRSAACAAAVLAMISLAAGRPDDARADARDALELLRTDRHPLFFAWAIEALARVATLRGDLERGALLQGYTQTAIAKLVHDRDGPTQRNYEEHIRSLTEALGAAEFARRAALGAQFSADVALAEALAV